MGADRWGTVHRTGGDGVCVEVVLVGSTAECAPVLANAGIGVAGNRVFGDVSLAPISRQRKPTVVVGCLDSYDWVLRHSDAPVLVVGGVGGLDDGLRALRAGAAGFLAAERIEGCLRCAVLAVARGTIYVDPRLVLHLLSLFDAVQGSVPRAQSSLSHRERQVVAAVTRGASNRDIARLAISARTVKNHISNSLADFGLANRTQLAVYGVRSGLVSVNDAPWELPAATDREVVDAALIS